MLLSMLGGGLFAVRSHNLRFIKRTCTSYFERTSKEIILEWPQFYHLISEMDSNCHGQLRSVFLAALLS
jgi:hypothetical protein